MRSHANGQGAGSSSSCMAWRLAIQAAACECLLSELSGERGVHLAAANKSERRDASRKK